MLFLAFFGGCASAPNESVSVKFFPKVLSNYKIFNGVTIHDDPVVETDLTLAFPKGFQLGLVHYVGLNDADLSSDFGDELDYTLGWSGKILGTDVVAGASYFDIVELGYRTKGVTDVIRGYLGASRNYEITEGHKLGPTAKLESRMRVEGHSDLGFALWVGAQHSWQISQSFSFSQKLRAIGDTGSIGFKDIVLGRYDAGFNYCFGKNVTWNIFSFTLTTPLTPAGNGQETGETYGTGLLISF